MNKEETKKVIEVMEYWVGGGEIEHAPRKAPNSWTSLPMEDNPAWDLHNLIYRIKPREFWIDPLTKLVHPAEPTEHAGYIKVREVTDGS